MTGSVSKQSCAEESDHAERAQAVGKCQVAVLDKKHPPTLNTASLATGKLMALVGALAIWGWKQRFGVRWRFFR